MSQLAVEYFFLVFISCCGVLQFVAARWKFRGISFFKSTISGYLFSVLAIAGAFSWFFIVEDRCVPGLEGFQVFRLFIAASLSAFVFTASISSVIKRKLHLSMGQNNPGEEQGLDSLRWKTYFQAVARNFRRERGG